MRVSPLLFLSGIGMIAVGVAFVLYWSLKKHVSSFPFLLGAGAWTVSVAMKIGFALSFNSMVNKELDARFSHAVAAPLFWIYIGLLTGVFECGFVLLLALMTRIKQYDFDRAAGFGIGFGAIEAILLGIGSMAAVGAGLWLPAEKLPPELLQSLTGSLWAIPAPIVERLWAVILHVFACVLIIEGVRTRRIRLFWLSFAYKTVIDAIAAWGQMEFKVDTLSHIWILEAIVAVYGVLGLWGLLWIRSRSTGETQATAG